MGRNMSNNGAQHHQMAVFIGKMMIQHWINGVQYPILEISRNVPPPKDGAGQDLCLFFFYCPMVSGVFLGIPWLGRFMDLFVLSTENFDHSSKD